MTTSPRTNFAPHRLFAIAVASTWIAATTAPESTRARSVRMGAIGDSITTAFNTLYPLDNPKLSWTTGLDPNRRVMSIAHRIQEAVPGSTVASNNRAFAGAKVKNMDRQVQMLAEGPHPQVITMLVGANDICSWRGPDHSAQLAEFERQYRKAVDRILTDIPGAQTVLVPVPDLVQVRRAGLTTCGSRWDHIALCPDLLSSDNPAQAEQIYAKRRQDVNEAIARIAQERQAQVHYASSIESTPIRPDDLSGLDCFHPSIRGQTHIAEAIWQAVDVPRLLEQVITKY